MGMRPGGVLSMIFILIIIYYIFRDRQTTVAIINAMASNATQGIKVLQGRG